MAELFGVNVDTIGLHIRNIYREEELETSTYEESSVVRLDGKRQVKRSIRIVRHISNIYKDGELDKSATCAENAQVQRVAMCGKRTLQMPIAQRWLSCFNDPYRREQSRGKRNHGDRDHEYDREIDI